MSATVTGGKPRPLQRQHMPPKRALVVGIGNTLMGDDGLGPIFLGWLSAHYVLRPPVQLLDGGTGGGGLIEWLEDGDDLILIDALTPRDGHSGGRLRILDRSQLEAGRRGLSSAAHELDLGSLLASAAWFGIELRSVQLLGVTARSTELAAELTPDVRASLPILAEALRHRLETLGFQPPLRR